MSISFWKIIAMRLFALGYFDLTDTIIQNAQKKAPLFMTYFGFCLNPFFCAHFANIKETTHALVRSLLLCLI